jgi:hypothetical protein
MIHSGLNMKAVSVLAGHSSIAITADRYGHLFARHEDEAGAKLAALFAPKLAPVSNRVSNEALTGQDLPLESH